MNGVQIFGLKLPPHAVLNLEQHGDLTSLVGQLQKYCTNRLLVVVNGITYRYYLRTSDLPSHLIFDHKHFTTTVIEYYFRQTTTQDMYCVFGLSAARLICPDFDGNAEEEFDHTVTITHNKKRNTFKLYDLPIVTSVISLQ